MNNKKEIYHFLKHFVEFIIFSIVFYFFLLIICGEIIPIKYLKNLNYNFGSSGFTRERLKEAKTIGNIDILFIGSSHCYRGFDPRIFESYGLKTFNLGSSSQSPIQTYYLLKKYLSNLKPKLIIYEVYPGPFTGDGIESALDIISNDENDLNYLKMAISLNHVKVYNTLFYSIFKNILKNFPDEQTKNKYDNYIGFGYVERKNCFYSDDSELQEKNLELNEKQKSYFIKTINLLKQNNIKYLLIEVPVTKDFYSKYRKKEDFDSWISNYGEHIDFNKLTILNDSLDFYDANHLNQSGVEKFNLELLLKIKNKNLF